MPASQPIDERRFEALLALNDDHAKELSPLDANEFLALLREAFFARCFGDDAFIVAVDHAATYASPNFLWFRERFPRFVYVDRVVVSDTARGRGLARLLYGELFQASRAAGHDRIVCEVNIRPPNPASDAFHARLGFAEIGSAEIHRGAKFVRYLERSLRG